MNTAELPADFTTWSATQKQAILVALTQEMLAQQTTDSLVVAEAGGSQIYLLGPLNPLQEIVLDDSTEELRELRRNVQVRQKSVPVETILNLLV